MANPPCANSLLTSFQLFIKTNIMYKYVGSKLIVLSMSVVFFACNSGEKTESTAAGSDTTMNKTAPMDSTAGATPTQTMDAVKAAPNLYKVLKDSMGIRILDVVYKPGDSSAMHSHPDYALYVIDGAKMEFTLKDGTKQVRELKSGTANILPGDEHSVKNIGKTTAKVILVEVSRPNKAGTLDPKLDPTKVAPTLYKTLKDTMNIRMVMASYKPGAASAMHYHPDNAVYVLSDSKAEFTAKDGTKQQMVMPKAMAIVQPGGEHSVKNVGKSDVKVLLVEVNRTQ